MAYQFGAYRTGLTGCINRKTRMYYLKRKELAQTESTQLKLIENTFEGHEFLETTLGVNNKK